MENNISNSDKTDEVHIEEYDKTDSVDSDDYGFDDIENESPEDVDFDEEVESEDLDDVAEIEDTGNTKTKRSITEIIGKQLPALANIINRVKQRKIAKKNESNKSDEDEGEKKPKAKFKLTPIHIIVIVGLVVILFFGDEETEVTTKPLKPIIKDIPKRKVEKPAEVVDTPKEVESESETTASDSVSDIRMENTPDSREKNDESSGESEVTETEINPVDEVLDTTADDSVMDDIELDIDKSLRDSTEESEVVVEEAPEIEGETNNQVDDDEEVSNSSTPTSEVDVIDESEPEVIAQDVDTPTVKEEEILPQEIIDPELSSDMTKKLLENLQVKLKEERGEQKLVEQIRPIGAPSYESPGSGLVYNCKGGHWACIDPDEYKKCRQNYSWNKSEVIPIECYPMAFLETDFDCGTVQQEKVNSVPDLKFCE